MAPIQKNINKTAPSVGIDLMLSLIAADFAFLLRNAILASTSFELSGRLMS
jgi:hypothetical protein